MAVPVVIVGLGSIGLRICARLVSRAAVDVVAAVDHDPAKSGRFLRDLLDAECATELGVTNACPAAPPGGGVAVQATSSELSVAVSQAIQLVELGWNVLSTCEELAYPQSIDQPILSTALDAAARRARVSVLASGVNPGFMMDALPLTLTSLCGRVDMISVRRVVNTNQRREMLQRKAGVGADRDEFRRLAARGRIGHVGLRQSVGLVAHRLGWRVDTVTVSLEPILAGSPVSTPIGIVATGSVIGQHQIAVGAVGGREVIRLELIMGAGQTPVDEIFIAGEPAVHQVIEGGLNGDIGTEAVIANLVRPVFTSAPGLLTMADLVTVAWEGVEP